MARSLLHPVLIVLVLNAAVRADDYPHLKMGNPSHAKEDTGDKNNFLMKKEFYALSYNNEKGTPNWVSWRLADEDLGNAPRRPFKPDPDLPDGFVHVLPKDYTNSGFDRGHMCPHSDRAKTDQMSRATFLMTNMVPQSHDQNTMAWDQLEIYLRSLVRDKHKVCYIIAGPAGKGGIGRAGFRAKIGGGKVTVPAKTWKVAMILDADVADPSQLTEDSNIRLLAVVMPNDDGQVGLDWSKFRTTVEEVEELTGFQFFGDVPREAIGSQKQEQDDEVIPAPVAVGHGNN